MFSIYPSFPSLTFLSSTCMQIQQHSSSFRLVLFRSFLSSITPLSFIPLSYFPSLFHSNFSFCTSFFHLSHIPSLKIGLTIQSFGNILILLHEGEIEKNMREIKVFFIIKRSISPLLFIRGHL